MNRIAFRYTDSPLATNTAYDSAATNQKVFQTLLKFTDFLNNVTVSGRTLGGRGYQSRRYSYREHEITIASDELGATEREFFENWSMATNRYIADLDKSTPVYVGVIIEDGRLPWTYPDSLEDFAQLELKLTEKARI
jgi:hypothetical protein